MMDTTERASLRALCAARTAAHMAVTMMPGDVAALLDALDVAEREHRRLAASHDECLGILDATAGEWITDAAARVTRERDEARAETADLRATVDTMQVQLDAHREWLATAQATGDEARAEVERLRAELAQHPERRGDGVVEVTR